MKRSFCVLLLSSVCLNPLFAQDGPHTTRVGAELLGHQGMLEFSQDESGLKINLPADKPCDYAYSFKITGLKMNPQLQPVAAGN